MSAVGAAVALGFGAGASFGPVNLEITKVGLIGRADDAAPLAAGTWTGDALLLVVLATLVTGASEAGGIDTGDFRFHLFAAALIIAIAVPALLRGPSVAQARESQSAPLALTVAKGVALSAFSPYGIVLWSGLGATVAASHNSLLSAALILAGDGLWFCLWLALLGKARSRVSPKAIVPIHLAANSALIIYAVLMVAL